MNIKPLLLTLLLPALVSLSCGDDDAVGPDLVDNPGGGTLSALIDSVAWTADVVSSNGVTGNMIFVAASDTTDHLAIDFGFLDADLGIYTVGEHEITVATIHDLAGGSWAANNKQGSGEITITTVNSRGVAGTFWFTAPTSNGATPATRVVTDGVFEVEYPTRR